MGTDLVTVRIGRVPGTGQFTAGAWQCHFIEDEGVAVRVGFHQTAVDFETDVNGSNDFIVRGEVDGTFAAFQGDGAFASPTRPDSIVSETRTIFGS